VAVLLVLLSAVLIAVFLSVKISLERDTRNDLNSATESAAELASHELIEAATPPVLSGEGSDHSDDDSDDDDHDVVPTPPSISVEPESSSGGLTRVFPIFVIDTSGAIVSGTTLHDAGLPNFASAHNAQLMGEDRRTIDTDNGPVEVLSQAVVADGVTIGSIQVAASISSQQRVLSILMVVLAIVGASAAVLAGFASFFLARRSMQPIEEAFSRQRTFIADAAHELRTPVAVVQADADALARVQSSLPDEDRALLEDLQRESKFIGDVVGRLLQIARLDAGVQPSMAVDFDLSALAQETSQAMHRVAGLGGIDISYAPGTSPTFVAADPIQIRLVLMSILDNAVKYNKVDGEITVKVYQSGNEGVVEVEDTGVGGALTDLGEVFSRFYRVDRARSRADGGVGLGLSIARAVVESNGGNITMQSAEGVGTTVRIALPTANAAH